MIDHLHPPTVRTSNPQRAIETRFEDIQPTVEQVRTLLAPPTDPAPSGLRVRRNEANLTPEERAVFLRALEGLRNLDGRDVYSEIVRVHENMRHRMHTLGGPLFTTTGANPTSGMSRFLAWHRVYLLRMEEALRRVEPTVSVPYWDWTRSRGIPSWLEKVLPKNVQGASSAFDVERKPGDPRDLPSRAEVRQMLNAHAVYTPFTMALEGPIPPGPHNLVHVWVGGTMAIVETSPADPLFWMHHAEVDRLWHLWQQRNPTQHPAFVGNDATMDPWAETYWRVSSVYAMGYRYEEETYP